jgi:diguanylate cyclase (GGDEF)-like protein/PAS domain S-box-containing protein
VAKRRKNEDPVASEQKILQDLTGGVTKLLDQFPAMVYRCRNDPDWTIENVSAGCLAVTGHPREDLLGNRKVSFGNLVHPEDADDLWERCQASLDQRKECNNEYRIIAADGAEKWIWDRAQGIYDASGELLAIEGFIVDITQRKLEEEARLENNKRFRGLFDASPDAVFVEDLEGYLLDANPEACSLHGRAREELVGLHFSELVPAEDRDDAAREFQLLARGEKAVAEGYSLAKDGSAIPVELRVSHIDFSGKPALLLHVRDITERKEYQGRLEYLARFDALTDLPNRVLFEDRLRQALARAPRSGEQIAVHYLDIDYFKGVNDTHGHNVGDELLKAVAERLGALLRETDTVARLGGDEFAILQVGVGSVAGATALAMKLLGAFARPFSVQGHEMRMNTSIGVAVWKPDIEGNELMEQADRALYRAKELGRNTFHFHDEKLAEEVKTYVTIRGDLDRALERDEFLLEYQPQIDLSSGRIVGCEALVRWQHPSRGLLYPNGFIPISEKTGLIVPLGAWILKEACRQRKNWCDAGLPKVSVAVNLSAVQFKDPGFARRVSDILDEIGLDSGLLEMELTESVLMQHSQGVQDGIFQSHERGIKIAIDDFGTGYSSLQYLRQFPVHKLKIAMEFVQGIADSAEDASIVEAVISLGHKLGLKVVAEGVESEEQLDFLQEHDCDEAQGFLFSRPVAPEVFAKQLALGPEQARP